MTKHEKALLLKLAELVVDLYSRVSNLCETDTFDKKRVELRILKERAELARELVEELREI